MSELDLFGGVSVADTGERDEFDFYETPAWMTKALLHFVPEIVGSTVLECCSGRDAITNVLRTIGKCHVWTNDLDTRQPAMMHGDARRAEFWASLHIGHGGFGGAWDADWIITNPPFGIAFEILQHALDATNVGVAFLLRKTFLEPTNDRGLWLSEHVPTRNVGEPRYSFRGVGNDSVSCDWMIWDKDGVPRRSFIDHLGEDGPRLRGYR